MKNPGIRTCGERLQPLVVGNITFKSADDHRLTESDMEKAYRNVREKESERDKCLQCLKDKLAEDSEVTYNTDGDSLLRYLRFSKFNCDRACKMIRRFYSLRKKQPEYFVLPANLEKLLNTNIISYLPYANEEGAVIGYCDLDQWNLKECHVTEVLQVYNSIIEIISMNPHCQINGVIVLFDLKGFSTSHVAQFLHPKMIVLLSNLFADFYPCRVQHIVAFNCNRFVQIVYRAIAQFLKKKIKDRVKFIGSDLSELHQYVNPALLPKECGGILEKSRCILTQHILGNIPFLEYQRSFGGI